MKEEEIEAQELKDEYIPERPTSAMPEDQSAPAGNLLELLDRILDKGVVVIGDIRVSVADIELLKIQIRLLVASVDKAQEMGIDFSWAKQIESKETETIKELEQKIAKLEKAK